MLCSLEAARGEQVGSTQTFPKIIHFNHTFKQGRMDPGVGHLDPDPTLESWSDRQE